MKNSFNFLIQKVTNKTVLSITLLLCCYNSNAQISSMIFPITPENQNYLRYLFFRNQFDSAEINCFIGEYRLTNSGTTTRINLNKTSQCNTVIQGDSAQGENSNLLPYSRSENFTMPSSGVASLTFYRNMTLYRIPCDGLGGGAGGGNTGGNGDGNGSNWIIGQGRIQDKTEFVTKLIRTSDNVVLAVIDSVGANTNPSSDTVFVYGTSPVKTKHTRLLPTGYPGISVYLQVSPRRYGPTPFGIDMKHECPAMWNYSSVIDSMGHGSRDTTLESSILVAEKALLFNYYDSIVTTTGHLPADSIINNMILIPALADSFHLRYFDAHTLPNSSVYYTEKDWGLSKHSDLYNTPNKKNGIICVNNICKIKDAEIQTILPNPSSGSSEIIINAYKDIANVSLYIYTMRGQRIGQVWSGSLSKGDNKISVNVSDYANGTYGIYCNNQNGETVDFDKIIIAK